MKVVLFEDGADAKKIESAIRKHLPGGAKVMHFSPSDASSTAHQGLYEDRLAKEVLAAKYRGADLWVTDRDLSRTSGYQGLSEAIVSKVADRVGIPICKYAQGAADVVFERQREWGDSQIVLDRSDLNAMGSSIAVIAAGFSQISKKLKGLSKKTLGSLQTPAAVMAHLLNEPSAADRIALYASGDQKMVHEILPFLRSESAIKGFKERLPSLFGYWLYESILRFPGLLVNETAAASYLNISVADFKTPPVRKLFAKALYSGPFSNTDHPVWWRAKLDDMFGADIADGNAYARSKLSKELAPCLDHGRRAGWYCMVTKTPVSDSNSVGNISWFPPGADLARVRKDIFEKAGPWLGLY